MRSTAMAQIADRTFDEVQLEVPKIGSGEGLLRIEACGICGSDLSQYQGRPDAIYPIIPGHEPVGIIEELGSDAAKTWGVTVGDRVAIIPHLTCGRCMTCLSGATHLCRSLLPVQSPAYGYIPMEFGHGLWGGYGEYIHLHPRTLLCKVPQHVPPEMATIYQALAGGLRWAVHVPKPALGDTVLVLGCGQRGLAAVVMLRAAGVRNIIITGHQRSAFKLDLARKLGATHTITADREDTVQRVMEITDGRGVDAAIDITPNSAGPVNDAIASVRLGGTIVLAGMKVGNSSIDLTSVMRKEIKLQGVFTQGMDAYLEAVDLLSRDLEKLSDLHTHEVPLEKVDYAMQLLAGEIEGEEAICISLHPDI